MLNIRVCNDAQRKVRKNTVRVNLFDRLFLQFVYALVLTLVAFIYLFVSC